MAEVDVPSLEDRQLSLSIRRLSDEFGIARETISKRLRESNVQSCGERNGFPVYRLRDACPAILTGAVYDEAGVLDPKTLPPDKRNAWYQSENRRLEFEMSAKQLIPAAEHEANLADMAKNLVQFLVTLPDVLERDANLSPEQVERMHSTIDNQRQALYEKIVTKPVNEAAA